MKKKDNTAKKKAREPKKRVLTGPNVIYTTRKVVSKPKALHDNI